ncbi:MAG: beta-lactamase family protein [Alphaproteobacteria bacterium]|nr:beta-lactamase family protein [Alphaproteobacteria bacterium]
MILRLFAAALVAFAIVISPAKAAPGPGLSTEEIARLDTAFDAAFAEGGAFARVGAVVAVVDHGRVVLLKGYGHEDVAGTRPVDPTLSRFMVASISKTFVGVRIAQLVRSGRIASLDDPANAYLHSFKLPKNRGVDVSVRDLLTHQAGFAEASLPMIKGVRAPATAADVGKVFPGYLRPVKAGSVYSNYGLAVAGAIIADLSNEPFADSLAKNVWAAAGMTRTGIGPSLDPGHWTQTAAIYPDGSRVALPDDVGENPVIAHGAGGVVSTGADMAAYMIALLGDAPGAPDRLLDSAGRDLIATPLASTAPLAQAYGSAFMLSSWNGVRLVEHGGRGLGRISYLILAPDKKLGVFVSVTAEGGAPAATEIVGQMLGQAPRLRPAPDAKPPPGLFSIRAIALRTLYGDLQPPLTPPTGPAAADLDSYVGAYRTERRQSPSPTYLLDIALRGAVTTVARDGEGLRINNRGGYRMIAPDTFWRDAAGERGPGYSNLVVFRRGPDGVISDLTFGYTDAVYAPLRGLAAPATFGPMLVLGLLSALTGLLALAWPRTPLWRPLALAAAAAVVALPFAFFGLWPAGAPAPFNLVLASEATFAVYRLIGTGLALAGIAWIAGAALVWRTPGKGAAFWWRRVHVILLACGGIALAIGLVAGQATFAPWAP